MKTNARLIALLTILFLVVLSCKNDQQVNPSSKETAVSSLVLGKKLENPYLVDNMKKAYQNIKALATSGRIKDENITIQTTHLYLKFKPKDEKQFAILKADSTFDWYEYPLDYEITQTGSYYRDPSIPAGIPTYQYTAVPATKMLPEGVEYEVLAQLFIPDENKIENTSSARIASDEFVSALVDEAFKITGNYSTKSARITASSWRPAGKIRVWDDVISNWRAVEGVEVKARRWFTTHKGYTNSNGDYSCDGTFQRDANYSLDWERYEFALREGWLDGANINGPKREGNWNLDFNAGASMFHARVFMAGYHYYYKDIKGLRRPPQNGTLNTQMHIRCYDEVNDDSNGSHKEERRFLGLGSQIKIYNPQNSIQQIYAITIHELAHASHWNMWRNGEDFDNSEKKVKESWARGVQWELTRMVWSTYPGGPTIRPDYTQVVVDMIDPNYPAIDQNLTNGLWNDNVEGYTIRQIEDALQGKKTWNEWRDNIKNSYDNATENNLDALFANWN